MKESTTAVEVGDCFSGRRPSEAHRCRQSSLGPLLKAVRGKAHGLESSQNCLAFFYFRDPERHNICWWTLERSRSESVDVSGKSITMTRRRI